MRDNTHTKKLSPPKNLPGVPSQAFRPPREIPPQRGPPPRADSDR